MQGRKTTEFSNQPSMLCLIGLGTSLVRQEREPGCSLLSRGSLQSSIYSELAVADAAGKPLGHFANDILAVS